MANGPRKGAAGFAAGLAGSLQDLPQLLLMKQQLQQQEEERERRERQRQEEIDRNLALRRQDIGREDAFRRQDRADLSQERFGREQDKSNALFLEASALKQFAQPGDPPVERTAQEQVNIPSLIGGGPIQGTRETPNVGGLTEALGALLGRKGQAEERRRVEEAADEVDTEFRDTFLQEYARRRSENVGEVSSRMQALGGMIMAGFEVSEDKAFAIIGGSRGRTPEEIATSLWSEKISAIGGNPEQVTPEESLQAAALAANEVLRFGDLLPKEVVEKLFAEIERFEPEIPDEEEQQSSVLDLAGIAEIIQGAQPALPGRGEFGFPGQFTGRRIKP